MARATGFDVVVVGAGAAGCVVAARLAEDRGRSVALIEAGPDLGADASPELHDGWSLPTTEFWGYEAEPDERGSVRVLRRGRLIGGTSWQTRFAVRGSPADFDAWAANGNAGWSFEDVLPWFRRIEADVDFPGTPWHGADGPLPISRYGELERSPVHAAAVQALIAAGFPAVDDHNRPGAVGVGAMPMNTRDGRRWSTADAWLPVDRRPANLTIRPDTSVDAVTMAGTRATGVRLASGEDVAATEVVLCAGVYGSPAILMRSGIGPADHLGDLGIRVRADLPGVGANLADHPQVSIDPGWRGTGRDHPILHSIATFRSRLARPDGAADLLFWFADPEADESTFEFAVVLMKPRSRGTVRLRSTEPGAAPIVVLPAMQDSADVERLAEGYRLGIDVANRPELRAICQDPPPMDEGAEAARRLVVAQRYSLPHVVGTCAMGPDPANGAVVDATGRAHGTDGLFVVDASIIPDAPSGFPHLVTIMLAERFADSLRRGG